MAKEDMLEIADKQTWARSFLDQELCDFGTSSSENRSWASTSTVPAALRPIHMWPAPFSDELRSAPGSEDPEEDECKPMQKDSAPARGLQLNPSDSVTSFSHANLHPPQGSVHCKASSWLV
eukprot:jgi/Botrbrau1/19486/Bobra.0749s0002.1